MQDAYKAIVVIDREEDAVRVRLPAVRQYSDGLIGVDALGRDGTPLRMLVQREDCACETVEPSGALHRRPLDHPQVKFLQVGFRAPRNLNAVCHASGAVVRRLAVQVWYGQP
jgi:hypothetical protein